MGGSFCEDAGVGVQNEYRGFKTPGDCMGERKSASPMRISRCERSDDDRTYEALHPKRGMLTYKKFIPTFPKKEKMIGFAKPQYFSGAIFSIFFWKCEGVGGEELPPIYKGFIHSNPG